MTTVYKAAVLLSLLLPVAAMAADQMAPVSKNVRSLQNLADKTAPASKPDQLAQAQTATAATAQDAAYVPKTAYDNSPYRFNAGARFTAAEFDAWMKSRGIRVAKGKPAAGSDAAAGTDVPATVSATDSNECNTQLASAC